jgi:hypothetical protein
MVLGGKVQLLDDEQDVQDLGYGEKPAEQNKLQPKMTSEFELQ